MTDVKSSARTDAPRGQAVLRRRPLPHHPLPPRRRSAGTPANCGTSGNRNGDRDTTWPGLQVDEGDIIEFTVQANNIPTGATGLWIVTAAARRPGSGRVVRVPRRRLTPANPSSGISRATRLRPTACPPSDQFGMDPRRPVEPAPAQAGPLANADESPGPRPATLHRAAHVANARALATQSTRWGRRPAPGTSWLLGGRLGSLSRARRPPGHRPGCAFR